MVVCTILVNFSDCMYPSQVLVVKMGKSWEFPHYESGQYVINVITLLDPETLLGEAHVW